MSSQNEKGGKAGSRSVSDNSNGPTKSLSRSVTPATGGAALSAERISVEPQHQQTSSIGGSSETSKQLSGGKKGSNALEILSANTSPSAQPLDGHHRASGVRGTRYLHHKSVSDAEWTQSSVSSPHRGQGGTKSRVATSRSVSASANLAINVQQSVSVTSSPVIQAAATPLAGSQQPLSSAASFSEPSVVLTKGHRRNISTGSKGSTGSHQRQRGFRLESGLGDMLDGTTNSVVDLDATIGDVITFPSVGTRPVSPPPQGALLNTRRQAPTNLEGDPRHSISQNQSIVKNSTAQNQNLSENLAESDSTKMFFSRLKAMATNPLLISVIFITFVWLPMSISASTEAIVSTFPAEQLLARRHFYSTFVSAMKIQSEIVNVSTIIRTSLARASASCKKKNCKEEVSRRLVTSLTEEKETLRLYFSLTNQRRVLLENCCHYGGCQSQLDFDFLLRELRRLVPEPKDVQHRSSSVGTVSAMDSIEEEIPSSKIEEVTVTGNTTPQARSEIEVSQSDTSSARVKQPTFILKVPTEFPARSTEETSPLQELPENPHEGFTNVGPDTDKKEAPRPQLHDTWRWIVLKTQSTIRYCIYIALYAFWRRL